MEGVVMKQIKKFLVTMAVCLAAMLVVPCVAPDAPFSVTVQAAAKVKLNKKAAYVTKGESVQLKISGTKKAVKWSSSNKKIATVNAKGMVKGVKKGTATITAKVGGKKYTCKVTVETPKISKTKATVSKGKTITLKMSGTKQTVKWSTSNKKIATVSNKGVVKGVKKGTATITAKVGSKKYTCKVTVNNTVALKSISLNKKSITLETDEEYRLKVTYNPSNTTVSKKVKWTSSDEDIAEVDEDGWVYAWEPGTATITAKVGDKKATCKVTVEDPDDDDWDDSDDWEDENDNPVDSNIQYLKDYILRYGSRNSDGNYFIRLDDYEYTYGIVYEIDSERFEFVYIYSDGSDKSTIAMELSETGNSMLQVDYSISAGVYAATANAKINMPKYNLKTDVYFNVTSAYGYSNSTIQELGNIELRIAITGWDILMDSKAGIELRDIGFSSLYY